MLIVSGGSSGVGHPTPAAGSRVRFPGEVLVARNRLHGFDSRAVMGLLLRSRVYGLSGLVASFPGLGFDPSVLAYDASHGGRDQPVACPSPVHPAVSGYRYPPGGYYHWMLESMGPPERPDPDLPHPYPLTLTLSQNFPFYNYCC